MCGQHFVQALDNGRIQAVIGDAKCDALRAAFVIQHVVGARVEHVNAVRQARRIQRVLERRAIDEAGSQSRRAIRLVDRIDRDHDVFDTEIIARAQLQFGFAMEQFAVAHVLPFQRGRGFVGFAAVVDVNLGFRFAAQTVFIGHANGQASQTVFHGRGFPIELRRVQARQSSRATGRRNAVDKHFDVFGGRAFGLDRDDNLRGAFDEIGVRRLQNRHAWRDVRLRGTRRVGRGCQDFGLHRIDLKRADQSAKRENSARELAG